MASIKTAGDIKFSISRSRRVQISISDTFSMHLVASTLTTSHSRHDASTVRHHEAATWARFFPSLSKGANVHARARSYVHLARIVHGMHVGSGGGRSIRRRAAAEGVSVKGPDADRGNWAFGKVFPRCPPAVAYTPPPTSCGGDCGVPWSIPSINAVANRTQSVGRGRGTMRTVKKMPTVFVLRAHSSRRAGRFPSLNQRETERKKRWPSDPIDADERRSGIKACSNAGNCVPSRQ